MGDLEFPVLMSEKEFKREEHYRRQIQKKKKRRIIRKEDPNAFGVDYCEKMCGLMLGIPCGIIMHTLLRSAEFSLVARVRIYDFSNSGLELRTDFF